MKNKVLYVITAIAAIVFLFSIAAMDSEDFTFPLILTAISGIWLALFAIANKDRTAYSV